MRMGSAHGTIFSATTCRICYLPLKRIGIQCEHCTLVAHLGCCHTDPAPCGSTLYHPSLGRFGTVRTVTPSQSRARVSTSSTPFGIGRSPASLDEPVARRDFPVSSISVSHKRDASPLSEWNGGEVSKPLSNNRTSLGPPSLRSISPDGSTDALTGAWERRASIVPGDNETDAASLSKIRTAGTTVASDSGREEVSRTGILGGLPTSPVTPRRRNRRSDGDCPVQ
jgi:hypothetical protein